MTGDGEAPPRFPREIAPNTFWFSTCLPFSVNGREVHNHNSCFLVIGRDRVALVDTGLPFSWDELKGQLLDVLAGRDIDYVFATHPESPHMGNAGPLMDMFPHAQLVGDLRNYHLYHPKLTHRFSHKREGDVLDLGDRQLIMVPAAVHDLKNTLWGYDTCTTFCLSVTAIPTRTSMRLVSARSLRRNYHRPSSQRIRGRS